MPFLRVEAWKRSDCMDAFLKKLVEDTLIDVKFSGLSWREMKGLLF
jgi:prolyl oligopeptidase